MPPRPEIIDSETRPKSTSEQISKNRVFQRGKKNYFVSLNPRKEIDPSLVHYQTLYSHPVYDSDTLNAQKKLNALQGENGLYFAGAKMGFGFHEDGLNSGLDVEKLLDCEPSWSKRKM